MTKMTDDERCRARVIEASGWGRSHRCMRRAVVGEYCKTHDPVRKQEKSDLASRKYELESKLRFAVMDRRRIAIEIANAVSNSLVRTASKQSVAEYRRLCTREEQLRAELHLLEEAR